MRQISFSMTEKSFTDGTKTVTRRLKWLGLKPGTRLRAVNKAMGLRPGERQRHLGEIEVLDVRRERLDAITAEDVAAEGVGGVTTVEAFVAGFCRAMACTPATLVTRIEFQHIGSRHVHSGACDRVATLTLRAGDKGEPYTWGVGVACMDTVETIRAHARRSRPRHELVAFTVETREGRALPALSWGKAVR